MQHSQNSLIYYIFPFLIIQMIFQIINQKQKMTETHQQQNITLAHKLKQIILTHYSNIPRNILYQKVRTEIIPILISLFCQNDYDHNHSHGDSDSDGVLRIGYGSQYNIQANNSTNNNNGKRNIIGEFKDCLMNLSASKSGKLDQNQKQNMQKQDSEMEGSKLNKNKCQMFTNIKNYMKSLGDIQIQTLLQKVISICKLTYSLQSIHLKKQNCNQIFKIYHQNTVKKTKSIKWLIKYNKSIKIKSIIMKFYTNYHRKLKQIQGLKCLHRLYVIKINNYYTRLIQNISLRDRIGYWNSGVEGDENGYLKLMEYMMKRMGKIIQNQENVLIKESFRNVINYGDRKIKGNQWRRKWVRTLVYKTAPNLQTSLWRLKNYAQNTSMKIQKQKQVQQFKQKQQYDQQQKLKSILQQQSNQGHKSQNIEHELIKTLSKTISQSQLAHQTPQIYQKPSKNYLQTQKLLQIVQQAQSNTEVEAILFTKQQKYELLCRQLQLICNNFKLADLIEGFTRLEALRYDHTSLRNSIHEHEYGKLELKNIEAKGSDNNLQVKEEEEEQLLTEVPLEQKTLTHIQHIKQLTLAQFQQIIFLIISRTANLIQHQHQHQHQHSSQN